MADYKIGGKFFGQGTNEDVVRRAINAMTAIGVTEFTKKYEKEGEEVARAMTEAGNYELSTMGTFIADNLFGIQSKTPPNPNPSRDRKGKIIAGTVDIPTQVFTNGLTPMKYKNVSGDPFSLNKIPTGKLSWPQLSLYTQRRKAREGAVNPSGFFTNTGELEDYFRNNAEQLAQATGGVKVTFNKKGFSRSALRKTPTYKELIGQLVIRIATKVKTGGVPALATGQWDDDSNERMPLERRLLPANIYEKLAVRENGVVRGDLFRPFFQPTLAFWMLHRVPRAIAKRMNAVMTAQNQRKVA